MSSPPVSDVSPIGTHQMRADLYLLPRWPQPFLKGKKESSCVDPIASDTGERPPKDAEEDTGADLRADKLTFKVKLCPVRHLALSYTLGGCLLPSAMYES